jgi:Short C-terminal domain/Phospholipase_D-nuclease N-terminal
VITAWDISLGETFLSLLWFFLFFLWVWLFITIFADIIRSDDLSGWGKAGWTILIIVLPYLGVFVYLVARGRSMGERAGREARRRDEAMRDYVREAASAPSTAQEIERLAALQSRGEISEAEFQQAKAKILA